MINGINVLAQSTVLVEVGTTWGFTPIAILGSLLIVIGIIFVYCMITERECPAWAPFALIIMLVAGIYSWCQKPIYQECIEYKGTIEDTVSLNKFNEKYIVISKEGELYTFRERADTELYK